ncbi:MAG: MFS transporter [Candidatus Methanodesulfokora washburnensis]|jgi:MFS family permease
MRDFVVKWIGSYRELGRDAKLVILSELIFGIGNGIYFTIWQLYLKAVGYSGTIIGMYSLISGITMSIFVVPGGYISDIAGKKGPVIASSVISAFSMLIVVISTDVSSLALSAVFGGIAWGLGGPSISALLADKAENRMEEGYSLFFFLSTAGMSVGNLLGWVPEFLVRLGGSYFSSYRIMLISASFFMFLSALPVIFVRESMDKRAEPWNIRKIRINKLLAKLFFLNFLIGFGAGFAIPLLPYYLSKKFSVESGPIGSVNLLSNIAGSLAYLAAPIMVRKIGMMRGLIIPQLSATILLLMLPYSHNFPMALSILVPRNILMNAVNPLWQALIMKSCDSRDRGTVNAISQLLWNLPNSVSAQIGGIMMDAVGLDSPVFTTGSIYLLYIFMIYILLKKENIR